MECIGILLKADSWVLLVIFGFLLNRVFKEIDALRRADQQLANADTKLAKALSDLRPSLIDREAFERHIGREERLISVQHATLEDLKRIVTDLRIELVTHIRLQQGVSNGTTV